MVQASRTWAAGSVCASIVASSRSTQHLVLDPPDRVGHRADVGDVGDLVVVRHPAPELVVEGSSRRLADADHLGADLRQRRGRTRAGSRGTPARRRSRASRPSVCPGAGATRCGAGLSAAETPRPGSVRVMVAAAFVAPYLLEATTRFVATAAALPGVRLGLITSEPLGAAAARAARRAGRALAGRRRARPAADRRGGQRAQPPDGPGGSAGRRLEQLQVPLAQVREALASRGWT